MKLVRWEFEGDGWDPSCISGFQIMSEKEYSLFLKLNQFIFDWDLEFMDYDLFGGDSTWIVELRDITELADAIDLNNEECDLIKKITGNDEWGWCIGNVHEFIDDNYQNWLDYLSDEYILEDKNKTKDDFLKDIHKLLKK